MPHTGPLSSPGTQSKTTVTSSVAGSAFSFVFFYSVVVGDVAVTAVTTLFLLFFIFQAQ